MKINHLAKPIKNNLQSRRIIKGGFGLDGTIGHCGRQGSAPGGVPASARANRTAIDAQPQPRPTQTPASTTERHGYGSRLTTPMIAATPSDMLHERCSPDVAGEPLGADLYFKGNYKK